MSYDLERLTKISKAVIVRIDCIEARVIEVEARIEELNIDIDKCVELLEKMVKTLHLPELALSQMERN